MRLKRFVADWAYERRLTPEQPSSEEEDAPKRSERVAIIGSGPAGLTAARDLSDSGYPVTVFEAQPEPGGMIRYGVPEYRMSRERLQWDIQNILSSGIELKTNHKVENIDSLLESGFDAVFIATGLQRGRKLPIPGSDLPDVMVSTDFLRRVNRGETVELGQRVLVLGGGNVAMDAARTAVRLGAGEVRLACLESREEMPADPWEIEDAESEGVTIYPSRSFLDIVSRDGAVTGVRCVKVKFHGFDEGRFPKIDPIKDTEHVIDADIVIFSIGQASETTFDHQGIDRTKFGAIKIYENTLATSKPGVFAGGDVVSGSRFIVDAIAAGHRAAESIDRYLRSVELERVDPSPSRVELTDEEIAGRVKNWNGRQPTRWISIDERVSSFKEFDRGYTEEMALEEASRCLECGICSECLLCQEHCSAGAIDHDMPKEKTEELDVGAIILSPGYEAFDARIKEELGYGRYPNVVNALEFERILSPSGPYSGTVLRPGDKREPERMAFIQCVGSRDYERDYCSSVCCMYATKQAIIAKEHVGDGLECDIFFMDMRAFGKGFEEYYLRAKETGVNYIRCRPPSIEEIPDTKNLVVEYLTENDIKASREYDLVVLSIGMQPPESVFKIAGVFDIELNEFSFCRTSPFRPIESTRDGIFASGPLTEPKDIPETVMQASGAVSKVVSLLQDVRYDLIVPKEYPPEKDVSGEEPRIGLFVCHCGTNIAGVVNVPDVVEYAKTLPNVVYTENNLYTCSNDTQENIKEKIEEHDINRVIVASCTPRTHEPLFRNTIREAGVNPYLFEMANIRDQCSWVHMHEPEKATEKAKDLVRMAAGKVRLLEPLQKRSISVVKSALVIGGGLSGMTAAIELGGQGYRVHLVEKEDEHGGNVKKIHYLLESEKPQDGLRAMIENVEESDHVQLYMNSRVESIEGTIGNFKSTVVTDGEAREIEHGVVIVATGAKEYKPDEYLYGQDDGVITQLELEQRLMDSPDWFVDDEEQPPRTVVMIQCVGSRDAERPFCSRVCCAEAVKNALRIKTISPETNVYILYRDIRVYGFRERVTGRCTRPDIEHDHRDLRGPGRSLRWHRSQRGKRTNRSIPKGSVERSGIFP
jgi:heterodisulfide reductase subunit A-like polyferredoxin